MERSSKAGITGTNWLCLNRSERIPPLRLRSWRRLPERRLRYLDILSSARLASLLVPVGCGWISVPLRSCVTAVLAQFLGSFLIRAGLDSSRRLGAMLRHAA